MHSNKTTCRLKNKPNGTYDRKRAISRPSCKITTTNTETVGSHAGVNLAHPINQSKDWCLNLLDVTENQDFRASHLPGVDYIEGNGEAFQEDLIFIWMGLHKFTGTSYLSESSKRFGKRLKRCV